MDRAAADPARRPAGTGTTRAPGDGGVVVVEGGPPASADGQPLAEVLSAFTRGLVPGVPVRDVLDDLVRRTRAVLGIAGAAASLQDGDTLRSVAAVDDRTANLERLQERVQAGPGVEAWRTGEVVAVDLRAGGPRWEGYPRAALRAGIVGVAGIPLQGADRAIGALVLYADGPPEWPPASLAVARVLADVATTYVVQASELHHQRRLTGQLQEALDARVVIEQAKGILAAERSVSVDHAFELLRTHARNRNASVRAVAEAVVRLGLRPPPAPHHRAHRAGGATG